MKLVKASKYVSGAYDQYTLSSFNVSKLDKMVGFYMILSEIQSDGTVKLTNNNANIFNQQNAGKIVDPNWNENSTPPKPANFSLTDVSTWGTITYDEIPLIDDPSKQFFDIFMGYYTTSSCEEAIFKVAVLSGNLPDYDNNDPLAWHLIS